MFNIGDLIVYGSTGVCRITDISTLDMSFVDKTKIYYVLQPIYHNEVIYSPIDNTKVCVRSVIPKEEAERLIDLIPTIKAEAYHNQSVQQLTEHYQKAFDSHHCANLIELIMSIYAKKQYVEEQKRKFGLVDSTFMKRAEDLLYGEFSIALGVPKEEVCSYISARVKAVEKSSGNTAESNSPFGNM